MSPRTPAAFVVAVSTADERVVESSLVDLVRDGRTHDIQSPAIVIVGEIAALRRGLLATMIGSSS